MIYYFGSLLGLFLIFWFYREEVMDYVFLKYSEHKRLPISNNYLIEKVNLYKNRELLKHFDNLETYSSYKRRYPELTFIEIIYTYLGKRYRIIFDKEFDFPPYDNNVDLPIGYKLEFLSCTLDDDKDITQQMNELLGPMRNFYKDINIKIPVSFFTDGKIECLDNNLNGLILSENLEIK